MKLLTRRSALRRLCALPAAAALGGGFPLIARAADYSLKYGNNLPVSHPLNIRAQEAADRILKESNGRVDIGSLLSVMPQRVGLLRHLK
ncbi:MAG: hypothetical protein KBO60_09295, partial [Achromobacter sp.]|nr:hypothetical protein [Achromobacter sp.]